MNGSAAKKIRREMRKRVEAKKEEIAVGLKNWVNSLSFRDRLKISFRIAKGTW